MIGTLDQERIKSSTSLPRRSGKARSRMIRSGALKVAACSPSAASAASCTVKPPCNSKPARRKRRIFGSSSINSTRLVGLLIGGTHGILVDHGLGQDDGCRGAASLTLAHDIDRPVIGLDESGGDPEAEADAGDDLPMTRASERPAAELRALFRGDAGSGIGDREGDVSSRGTGGH